MRPCTGLQCLTAALRPHFLSRGSIGLDRAFKTVILCVGVNNILPVRLGEPTKVACLLNRAAFPWDRPTPQFSGKAFSA